MTTTLSSKYQVVIPKVIRRKYSLKPGQKMEITDTVAGQIVVKLARPTPMTHQEVIDRYAGALAGVDTPWKRAGKDPAIWLRQQRDADR